MEKETLVRLIVVVVVPIDQRSRHARSQRQRIHGGCAGDIHFARAGHEAFAHHAHHRADVDAVILLDRIPALQRSGVDGICVHPVVEDDGQLGHQRQFFRRRAAIDSVRLDRLHLGAHACMSVVDLLGRTDHLGEIHRRDVDPGGLQQFFAVAHRLEGVGPRANCTESR